MNSAHGPVAEYWKNDDQYLYFFLKDHLGTPRVYMQGPPTDTTVHVGFYANYYPFGELLERGGNIFSDFAFTGKEHDIHSSFDYYYFGSRYYDPRTGAFLGIDKAGQFASGFSYGNNNPTIGTDPDGNLFFLSTPFIIGALFGMYQGAEVANVKGTNGWGFMGHMLLGGAIGGLSSGLGSTIASTTSEILGMAASSAFTSSGFSLLSEGMISPEINFGLGTYSFGTDKTKWLWQLKNENAMELLEDVTTLGAIAKDAFRIQLAILGGNKEAVQEYNKYPRGPHGQAGYKRYQISEDEARAIMGGKGKMLGILPEGLLQSGDENFMNTDRIVSDGFVPGSAKVKH